MQAKRRYELTDAQWARLESLLPPEKPWTGRPNDDHRQILNGILWVLNSGAPWRDLPRRYGPVGTVSSRFYRWRRSGVWQRVLEELQADAEGRVGWELHFLDSTVVRAHQHAAGARKAARGRGAGPLARRLHDPCALRGLRQAGHLRADRGARQPAGDGADRPRRDPPHQPGPAAPAAGQVGWRQSL
jgi:transposase